MARKDMKDWERLLARALRVVDAAQGADGPGLAWTLGGGSVLVRRYRHRVSAGVDIFVRGERMLARIGPRLDEAPGAVSSNALAASGALRAYFPEGEVAFIASALVTSDPVRRESILGRPVLVETSAEILARKLRHRAASFPARDLFDFTAVATFEPDALHGIGGVLGAHRAVLLRHLLEHGEALREDFAALHSWEFQPRFEECVEALRAALYRASQPPVVEQERYPYEVPRLGPPTPPSSSTSWG